MYYDADELQLRLYDRAVGSFIVHRSSFGVRLRPVDGTIDAFIL